MPQYEIQLDWCDNTAPQYAASQGLTARLVMLHGPGGGNPLYAFTGDEATLRKFVAGYVDDMGAGDDYEWYWSQAYPVQSLPTLAYSNLISWQ